MATVHFALQNVRVSAPAGTLLLDVARREGLELDSPCDGSGSCGKCRVKVAADTRGNVTEADHDFLNNAERNAGWILACQATVQGDVSVEVQAPENDGLRILSEGHAVNVAIDPWFSKTFDAAAGVTVVYGDGQARFTEPGDTTRELYGVAVDIGTTTLVAALIDLRDGHELASASSLNPQARHAQDVLSRIKFGSTPEGLATLQGELIEELSRLIQDAAGQARIPVERIYEAVFSGNTTMLHLAVGADPEGSILSGDTPHSFKVEGIGEDFIPKTFNRQVVDEMVRVSDKDSFNFGRRLAREEGILLGGSSGTALAAALKYAQRLADPREIVVLLPDTGRNYLSKMYSDEWMNENGFWQGPVKRPLKVAEVLGQKKGAPSLISVHPQDKLKLAIQLFQTHNISQLPVLENGQVVGGLNEASIMKSLHDGVDLSNQEIRAVMGKALPVLDEATDISEAYRLLLGGSPAIIVLRNGAPYGLISRFDLINALMQKDAEYGI